MRSCVCKEWGPPSSLSIEESLELPQQPKKGEVAVAVSACAVNFPDLLMIQGKYQVRPKLPFSPGGEAAGVVIALGEGSTRFRVGDRVLAFIGYGGFTTDLVVKEKSLVPLPPGMDFITASSFLVTYGTADLALRVLAKVRKGELVLVLGASGGVGLAAIQLAKAVGATVIAAASSPDKLQACRDSGADLLLNYREEALPLKENDQRRRKDWRSALKRLTGGRGVDIVVDNVGGADCEPAIRSLAIGGRYLVVGFASGTIPSPPLNLVLLKEVSVLGVHWGAWREREPQESDEQMKKLVRLFGLGLVRPVISRVYPLDEAPRALEDIGARRVVGKVVIATRPQEDGGRNSQAGHTSAISRL